MIKVHSSIVLVNIIIIQLAMVPKLNILKKLKKAMLLLQTLSASCKLEKSPSSPRAQNWQKLLMPSSQNILSACSCNKHKKFELGLEFSRFQQENTTFFSSFSDTPADFILAKGHQTGTPTYITQPIILQSILLKTSSISSVEVSYLPPLRSPNYPE